MTRADAIALWGEAAVAHALDDPDPPAPSPALLRLVAEQARGLSPPEFAWWALRRPWPEFVSIVRLVAGITRRDALNPPN